MNLKKLLLGIAVFVVGVGVCFLQLLPEVSSEITYLGIPLAVFGCMLIIYSFNWNGHGHVPVHTLPQVDRDALIEYFFSNLLHLYEDAVKIYLSKDKMRAVIIRRFEDNTFAMGELCLDLFDEEQVKLVQDYGGWIPGRGPFGIYDTVETAIKENAYLLNDMEEVDMFSFEPKKVRKLTIIREKRFAAGLIKADFYLDEKQYGIANGETVEMNIDEGMHVLNTVDTVEFIGKGVEDVTVYIKCKYSFFNGSRFVFVKKD